MSKDYKVWRDMVEKWPSAVVARGSVSEFTGGMITGSTVANADSNREGPATRINLGKKTVGYPVADFVEWLKSRSKVVDSRE